MARRVLRKVDRSDPLRADRTGAAAQIGRAMRAWRGEHASESTSTVNAAPKPHGINAKLIALSRKQSPTARDLGPSNPLDGATKNRMAGAFGQGFDDVAVHTGAAAKKHVAQLGVDAVTVGKHVAFGEGAYQPGSQDGDRLIAHELGHTLQQRGADAKRSEETPIDALEGGGAHEDDADRLADRATGNLEGGNRSRIALEPTIAEAPEARGGSKGGGEKKLKHKQGDANQGGDDQPSSEPPKMSLEEAAKKAALVQARLQKAGVTPEAWAFTGSFALALWGYATNTPLRAKGDRGVGDLDILIKNCETTFDNVQATFECEDNFKQGTPGKRYEGGKIEPGTKGSESIDVLQGGQFGHLDKTATIQRDDKSFVVLAIEELIDGYENVIAEFEGLVKQSHSQLEDQIEKERAEDQLFSGLQLGGLEEQSDELGGHDKPKKGTKDKKNKKSEAMAEEPVVKADSLKMSRLKEHHAKNLQSLDKAKLDLAAAKQIHAKLEAQQQQNS